MFTVDSQKEIFKTTETLQRSPSIPQKLIDAAYSEPAHLYPVINDVADPYANNVNDVEEEFEKIVNDISTCEPSEESKSEFMCARDTDTHENLFLQMNAAIINNASDSEIAYIAKQMFKTGANTLRELVALDLGVDIES